MLLLLLLIASAFISSFILDHNDYKSYVSVPVLMCHPGYIGLNESNSPWCGPVLTAGQNVMMAPRDRLETRVTMESQVAVSQVITALKEAVATLVLKFVTSCMLYPYHRFPL